MGLHETKKLLYSKGSHHQNEMAIYWMEEDICKSHIYKGLISKLYKELIQFSKKKNKQSD